jgi:hypothetical protein
MTTRKVALNDNHQKGNEEQRAECSKIRAVITQLLQEFNSAENSVEAVYSGRNTSNPNGTKTYADAAQSIIAFEPVLPR